MGAAKLEFDKIFNLYQAKVRRYVSRLVGEHDADDVTQEVFLKVAQGLARFQGKSQVSTWIYRIATNACLDRLRSPAFRLSQSRAAGARPEAEVEGAADAQNVWPGGEPSTAEKKVIREEMEACFMDMVQKMPKNYQGVILLSTLEGLSNADIGKILNLPLETVKIRLHRARARLRKELEAHCGFDRDARNILSWDGRIF